ncbi:HNH endonuclease [Streptomyces sp. NPDC008139]|uniref:HNH endonuclease n=1 Tax=Streptomyces sp. NPDC008139 TaxID=3364814 RepID=UPI0036E19F76
MIVLWDGDNSLGMSVIEDIETGEAMKDVSSCPVCGKADIALRKTMSPKYRCWTKTCKAEFDEPRVRTVRVTTYRSHHEAGWVELPGTIPGKVLRELCEQQKSQNALRKLLWQDFRASFRARQSASPLTIIDQTRRTIAGGHSEAIVRVRRGQPAFRAALLKTFGEVCAFTGPCPAYVLEAAHLYSYAANGEHYANGGLLLRRDTHRLFDLGEIAINPQTLTLDITERTRAYPDYARLHGRPLSVAVRAGHQTWIARHWDMHRTRPAPQTTAG